jgi:hypothetical protein
MCQHLTHVVVVVDNNKVEGMFICMVLPSVGTFVAIGYPTWLPGAIKASDWLKFLMIFFYDTT